MQEWEDQDAIRFCSKFCDLLPPMLQLQWRSKERATCSRCLIPCLQLLARSKTLLSGKAAIGKDAIYIARQQTAGVANQKMEDAQEAMKKCFLMNAQEKASQGAQLSKA